MKFVAGAAAALAVGLFIAINPAVAAVIDLATWTCAKFEAADKDESGMILTWLDGYYREEDAPPVIDTEDFATNAKKLNEYCSMHPETGLMTAADELFSR
jgi:acid stress chaperone HdeB